MPRDLPTTTLEDVVLSDLKGLKVTTGPIVSYVRYEVRGTTDTVTEPHHSGTLQVPMPAALRADIAAWLAADVLPAINTKEGTS
jgi:hypothetical protein